MLLIIRPYASEMTLLCDWQMLSYLTKPATSTTMALMQHMPNTHRSSCQIAEHEAAAEHEMSSTLGRGCSPNKQHSCALPWNPVRGSHIVQEAQLWHPVNAAGPQHDMLQTTITTSRHSNLLAALWTM